MHLFPPPDNSEIYIAFFQFPRQNNKIFLSDVRVANSSGPIQYILFDSKESI